ncbi:MAG: DNA repair protein RecN [Bacteroides sp.]|nr:DNA repair protein RecN [Bacteroides sp.]
MLCSLHISNYALIDSIELHPAKGLNIITGETGGGKSIMLAALSLLLGERADPKSIRNTEAKSVIEAVFNVSDNAKLKAFCLESEIEWDDSQIILRREISPSSRSRAFINDSPVTLNLLRSVGLMLVDIHSQHQNRLLSSPTFQLDIIDTLADNHALLADYENKYSAYKAALHKLKAAKVAILRDRENEDFMQYQLQRINQLNPLPDEETSLQAERERLSEAASARELFNNALSLISYGDANMRSLASSLRDAVSDASHLLPESANIDSRLAALSAELNDIADTIESASAAYPADALSDLEVVDSRLNELNSVLRRHNLSSANELIAEAQRLSQKLARLEDADNILATFEKQARAAKKAALDAAAILSERRRAAAHDFGEMLRDTAMPLGMKNLVCDISVEPTELSFSGADKVEFRFAFNKNQQPVPVAMSASGGEISRLMLSIKSIIAHKMQLPSIIFDEVDTGVSGDVANRIGQMMQSIARNIQVIAITHLPQVAAKGSRHFKVAKHDTDNSTVTHVTELSPSERVSELALMLSGHSSNQAAIATAKELLENS